MKKSIEFAQAIISVGLPLVIAGHSVGSWPLTEIDEIRLRAEVERIIATEYGADHSRMRTRFEPCAHSSDAVHWYVEVSPEAAV